MSISVGGNAAIGPEGPEGDPGDPGVTPAITIGTVTNVGPSGPPTVTISGTIEAPILSFGLQQGTPGTNGINGLDGDPGGLATPADVIGSLNPTSKTFRWPPGVQTFGPTHHTFRLRFVANKRNANPPPNNVTNAFRFAEIRVYFYGEPGSQVFNLTQHAPEKGWITSATPLTAWGTGTTIVTITAISPANGQWYLQIECSLQVPAHAPNGLAWACDGLEEPTNALATGP